LFISDLCLRRSRIRSAEAVGMGSCHRASTTPEFSRRYDGRSGGRRVVEVRVPRPIYQQLIGTRRLILADAQHMNAHPLAALTTCLRGLIAGTSCRSKPHGRRHETDCVKCRGCRVGAHALVGRRFDRLRTAAARCCVCGRSAGRQAEDSATSLSCLPWQGRGGGRADLQNAGLR